MQELLERGGLELLAAFAAVAEAGSFTEAAKKLGRDASIVSRRVTQLEQQLGVSLLSRTTRRVALTEVGALYHRRIQGILDELAEASREASDVASSPQGLLRVSLPATFGRQWIAPLLPRFLSRHPQIRIDARFSDRQVDVVSEGFDVAIRVGVLRDSSLSARKLASYRNLLVAAPSYLTARGKPRTPDDLKKHSCIGFTGIKSWPDWPLTRGNQRKTVRPAGPFVADNSEAVLIAAIAGVGDHARGRLARRPCFAGRNACRDLARMGRQRRRRSLCDPAARTPSSDQNPHIRRRDRQINQGWLGEVAVMSASGQERQSRASCWC